MKKSLSKLKSKESLYRLLALTFFVVGEFLIATFFIIIIFFFNLFISSFISFSLIIFLAILCGALSYFYGSLTRILSLLECLKEIAKDEIEISFKNFKRLLFLKFPSKAGISFSLNVSAKNFSKIEIVYNILQFGWNIRFLSSEYLIIFHLKSFRSEKLIEKIKNISSRIRDANINYNQLEVRLEESKPKIFWFPIPSKSTMQFCKENFKDIVKVIEGA